MKYSRLVMIVLLLMVFLLLSSCSSDIDESIYRYQDNSCPLSEPARNLMVMTLKRGVQEVVGVTSLSLKGDGPYVYFNLGNPGHIVFGDVPPEFEVESLGLIEDLLIFVPQGFLLFGDDGILPVQIDDSGTKTSATRLTFPCLDNPGTENIRVVYDIEEPCRTKIAGLWWDPALISIREDGIVLVDKEGRKAYDADGNEWISVWNRKLNGYVMVKDE
jgi:hypothetical protein